MNMRNSSSLTQVQLAPIPIRRSIRTDGGPTLTSGDAGKILPIRYIPLHREDRLSFGRYVIDVESTEFEQMPLNAIAVTAQAWFIPYLAFPRFNGSMDLLNKSFSGKPFKDGDPVVPFVHTNTPGTDSSNSPVMKTMGLHYKAGQKYNTAPLEAYNVLVNHRYSHRSSSLPERGIGDETLATCFWRNHGTENIVPDFDQAMLHGEFDAEFAGGQLKVTGIGRSASGTHSAGLATNLPVLESDGPETYDKAVYFTGANKAWLETDASGVPQVFAELAGQGVPLSLATIEQAKKTQAFAKLRANFEGKTEDWVIDLLMRGIAVDEARMAQPMLLDQKTTILGYNQRFATDSDNLEKSLTDGRTQVELGFGLPQQNTGGIVLITVEIVPEQLFERKKDYFLSAQEVSDFPDFIRDEQDEEKVTIVKNDHLDIAHTQPTGTFGYMPLNKEWNRHHVRIGGKFHKTAPSSAFSEDRARMWLTETVDPLLTDDFYLANGLNKNPFKFKNQDGFEIHSRGESQIEGNTVFGGALQEATDDYDILSDQAGDGQIQK